MYVLYVCYLNIIIGVLIDKTTYGTRNHPYKKFVWNIHLLKKFEDFVHPEWILYIIHGFVGQSSIFYIVSI